MSPPRPRPTPSTGPPEPASPGRLDFEAEVALGDFRLSAAFEVGPGETIALVGPSGSGKSTCLSLIAGLIRPDRARIHLGGVPLCDTALRVDLPPDRRRVGLLFQEYALFPHLSVRQNVAYGPAARRRGRAEARAMADRWLQRLHIAEWADRPVTPLSGGQRQRVALARALASDARVLLLDEPFGALDVATRASIRGELRSFLSEVGLPTVLVTHDPVDALVFGDRLVILSSGRVAQSGKREDLLSHPRTPFVAELAGLNLLEAHLEPGRGLKRAAVGAAVFHVLSDDHAGTVFLAFAPSEVILSTDRFSGSAQNAFAGVVKEIVPLPDRVRVVMDIGCSLTAEITRPSVESLHLAPGQRLWAAIKATAIRVYT